MYVYIKISMIDCMTKRTDDRLHKRIAAQTDKRTNGWLHKRIAAQTDKRTNGWLYKRIAAQTDKCTNGWLHKRIAAQTDNRLANRLYISTIIRIASETIECMTGQPIIHTAMQTVRKFNKPNYK